MFASIKKRPKLFGDHLKLFWTRKSPSTQVDTYDERDERASLSKDPIRTLLIHGSVELKRGWRRQKRHLFLFSDLLLVSNTKYRKNFKIKAKIPLNTMWMADCVDEVGRANTSVKKSFVLGWPTVNFMATFSSSAQKEQWHSYLQRYINLAKEKDHSKSIPLEIFTEDINNCTSPINITVTNSDTVNDIINRSLPMLGITGCKSDYQLWVRSSKKKSSYLLIGHEHPYEIKMSHLQANALLPHGPKGSTSPSTLQQASQEIDGQFILKSRRPVRRGQEQKDADQKTVKRKWSFISRVCGQDSSTDQDNLCTAPPPCKPGKFFGLPLTDVCENDDIPTPLKDMFFFINQEGQLKEGIFRISASARSCRVLKEKLDSGENVNLENESVFVVASVLKDFFRNIKENVFSSNLYDEWLAVIDQANEEEKITEIRRLLDQLPKANIVLLRYLFGLLHNIEQHSATNQMTAYNLSVCIAPSILWSLSCSSEVENELTKKVCLVQFIIENYFKIFGEDMSSLFGESSKSCDSSEKTSEVTTEQPLETTPVEVGVIVIYIKAKPQDYDKTPSDVDQLPVH